MDRNTEWKTVFLSDALIRLWRTCPPEADWSDSADLPAFGGLVRLWRDRLIGFRGEAACCWLLNAVPESITLKSDSNVSNMSNETYGKKT